MVVLDIVKAVAAILIARYGADLFALRFGDVAFLAWREGGAAVGCLLGHCFPLWSRAPAGGGRVPAKQDGGCVDVVAWVVFCVGFVVVGDIGDVGFFVVGVVGDLFVFIGGEFVLGWGCYGLGDCGGCCDCCFATS